MESTATEYVLELGLSPTDTEETFLFKSFSISSSVIKGKGESHSGQSFELEGEAVGDGIFHLLMHFKDGEDSKSIYLKQVD
jgi:hypothetical protein